MDEAGKGERIYKVNKDIAKEKLKKIRELAERGIDGEKEQARKMYERLLEKYEISDEEIADKLEMHWFRYKTELEESLLVRVFYAVTGSEEHYGYKGPYSRRKERGVLCTEAEAAEIDLLFSFYREEIKRELTPFMIAFFHQNKLRPDKSARLYKPSEGDGDSEIDPERARMLKKAAAMCMTLDGNKPPRALIEKLNE